MQQTIGFDHQKANSFNCGQRALIHALLLLGTPLSEDDAHKTTKIPRWFAKINGTNEKAILRGIRKVGCVAYDHSYSDPEEARAKVDSYLKLGLSIILCVEDFKHWAVLAGRSGDKYMWIDSFDDALIGAWSWNDITDWIESDEFYFIAVSPMDPEGLRHSIVPQFSSIAKTLKADTEFAQWYGYFLEDLLEVFDCTYEKTSMSAKDFFDKYGETIYQNSVSWYAYADEQSNRWEYENMKRVALAHKLTVSIDRIPEAIAGLTATLTCIACGCG